MYVLRQCETMAAKKSTPNDNVYPSPVRDNGCKKINSYIEDQSDDQCFYYADVAKMVIQL